MSETTQFRFPLDSPDPWVVFAAQVERGIAAMKAKEDHKKDTERLSAVFGTPEEKVKDISLEFDNRLTTATNWENKP